MGEWLVFELPFTSKAHKHRICGEGEQVESHKSHFIHNACICARANIIWYILFISLNWTLRNMLYKIVVNQLFR